MTPPWRRARQHPRRLQRLGDRPAVVHFNVRRTWQVRVEEKLSRPPAQVDPNTQGYYGRQPRRHPVDSTAETGSRAQGRVGNFRHMANIPAVHVGLRIRPVVSEQCAHLVRPQRQRATDLANRNNDQRCDLEGRLPWVRFRPPNVYPATHGNVRFSAADSRSRCRTSACVKWCEL